MTRITQPCEILSYGTKKAIKSFLTPASEQFLKLKYQQRIDSYGKKVMETSNYEIRKLKHYFSFVLISMHLIRLKYDLEHPSFFYLI